MSSPDLNIYPDEMVKLQLAQTELERRFEFATSLIGDAQRAEFADAAKTEFAKAGFEVSVEWKQLYEKEEHPLLVNREVPTGVWFPYINIEGRVKPEEETDHDRFQWGVVKGLADGQKGYVREDGSKREDPIKKIIT